MHSTPDQQIAEVDREPQALNRYSLGREDDLVLIPPVVQKCVVFLGIKPKKDPDRIKWAATGFLVCVRLPMEEERFYSYLVTAQHCINKARRASADQKVYIRVNRLSGGVDPPIESHVEDWQSPREVDVSVLSISAALQGVDYGSIIEDTFLDPVKIRELRVLPGEDVFVAGLFVNYHGQRRNVPIIRVGNIAAMPDEPVLMGLDDQVTVSAEAYLIESRSLGGLSGSPVFVHRGGLYLPKNPKVSVHASSDFGFSEMTIPDPFAPPPPPEDADVVSNYFLLGLIHGHWELREPLADTEDMSAEIKKSVNAGIAKVVPAHVIREVLDAPELVREREEVARRLIDEGVPKPDMEDSSPAGLS